MSKLMKVSFKLLDLLVIFVMTFGAPMSVLADPSPTGATITTQLPDYPPGSTVLMTGEGWAPLESVHVIVNDQVGNTWTLESNPDPVTNDIGVFTYEFQLPDWFVATYLVTATGFTSGTATVTFTDLNIGTYDQCSNDDGDGYNGDPGNCQWINGNLQRNNSVYMEGDATVQRLWLTDLVPGSTHSVTLKYGTTKGGKHAYDFLTAWDWSEDWITLDNLCAAVTGQGTIDGCTTAAQMTYPIPDDPNVTNTIEVVGGDGRLFTMAGGSITAASTPQIVSGDYTGDSETVITVNYTVGQSTGSMCSTKGNTTTCGVMLWFGAHVSVSGQWKLYNNTTGAGTISGSPYHVALDAVDDGSVGQRDNQMQAEVITYIPNGTIILVKDAVPNDAQDFSFNLNNNSTIDFGTFYMDDDADPAFPNTLTFDVPPGAWTAKELMPLPAGWSLTTLVCVDPTSNTTVDLATGTATINLASLETVTCTYTNTESSTIIINKTTTGGDATFAYITTGGDGFPADFNITTSKGTGSQTYNNIVPGSYSVTESALAGWTFSSLVCTDPDGGTTVTGQKANIDLDAGETVTCTFTNSFDTGSLKLTKSLTGGPADYTGPFTVHYDCGTGFTSDVTIAAGSSQIITGIPSGTSCTISEPTLPTPPAGYSFGTPTFNPSDLVTIGVGTTIEVTTNNTITRDQGYFKIAKVFDPKTSGFNDTFAIKYDCGAGGVTINLAAGESKTVGPFDTGTSCTVSEPTLPTAPTGWTFGAPSISPTQPVTIGADPVEVTVTNTITRDTGSIKITKVLDPLTSGFTGTFEIHTDCVGDTTIHYTASLRAGEYAQYFNIPTGTSCTVSESTLPTAPTGWTFGTPSISPVQPVTIVKDTVVSVTVTNSITRDLGSFKITKSTSNPDGATLPAAFTGTYDCGTGYTGNFSVADGASQTISGIPTGNTCSVVESIPDPITGYTWGTPTYTPTSIVISDKGGTFEIVVGNSITRDLGSLKLSKTLIGGPEGYTGPFQINYDCDGIMYDGSASVNAGGFAIVPDIPTGTQCTISETLPTPPAGYAFATPTFNPSETVTISEKGAVIEVITLNKMGQDLKVTKTAAGTFNRTYHWLIDKSVDDTRIEIADGGTATFHYTVKVTPDGYADSGWMMGGTITVHNPNNWEDITADVTDSFPGGICTVTGGEDVIIPAGQSVMLDYSCAFDSQPTYTGTNTATATWDKAAFFTPNGAASGEADVMLTLKGETNRTITVMDDKTTGTSVTLGTSDYYAGPFEFTYSLTKSGIAGKCTDYTNTAVIDETKQSDKQTVTVCVGKDITVAKTAAGTFNRSYFWNITKNANQTLVKIAEGGSYTFDYTVMAEQTGFSDAGWTLSGKITLTNPNDWEDIALTSLTDTVDNGGTCIVDPGQYVVPKSGSLDVNYSCSYAIPSEYSGTNTATANWDKATYFTPNGTASGNAGFTLSQAGAANQTIHVTDTYGGDLGTITATNPPAAPVSGTFTYTRTERGVAGKCTKYDNTATITETGQSADKTVTLCVGKDLTVTKTVYPTFTRSWGWTITKDFDATYDLFAGQSVTHGYKVTVTPDFTDSAWQVFGTITISNPNEWEAIAANVSDAVDDGGTCVVDDEDGKVSVPANDSVDVGYTCTWDTMPTSYNGINTATVTWDATTYSTPQGTASGSMDFEFKNPNEINPVITVDDDNLTGEVWSANREYAEWTYTKDFSCSTNSTDYASDGKYDYSLTNTATINETTGDSDTATVMVNCYAPVVSKTAAGTYDERHEWTVEKSVSPTSQSAFAGDTVSYEWTVVVTQDVTEEHFKVAGEITVVNPAPMEMTVDLFDELGGGMDAVIGTCTNGAYADGKLTIPANTTATCAYAAEPGGRTDTVNNVTATLNGITFDASATFGWTANVIRGSVSLDDNQNPAFQLDITEGGTWNYTEQYTCSTVKTDYDATTHMYSFGESNTVTVKNGETTLDSSTVSTSVDCYVPTISKDANGKYDEVHDWEVYKSVNTASQTAFAGEKKNFTWTVRVDETTHGENYIVNGKITVVNPNPQDALTVSLIDALNDGSIATIGPCTGGTWTSPNLTVTAGATAICDYTVTPKGNKAAFNLALPASVGMAHIDFPENGDPAYFEVVDVTGGGALTGSYQGWSLDTDITMTSENVTGRTANVYSSLGSLPLDNLGIEHPENLDLVNWIINQDFVYNQSKDLLPPDAGSNGYGESLGNYTYGDVQRAIWELVDNSSDTDKLNTWNQNRVNEIKAMAQASGEGFVPSCNDYVGIILEPLISEGGTPQRREVLTLAQVSYASLNVQCATSNTATAVLNGIEFPASADISWTVNKINETASLDDDQKLDWPTTVSTDTTFTYQDPQGYTCSTDPAAYTNGYYQYNESNTAILTFSTGSDTATASTVVKCYAPVVTKTAAGAYDERHEWDVEKAVDPTTQNAFAGDTVSYEWTVNVTESVFEENFVASGTISVKNPRPDDGNMTVKLSDVLSDSFVPTITGCTGGSWNATNKTVAVPPSTTAVCSYTASLTYSDDANAPTLNTVTATFNGLTAQASDAIEWSKTVIRGTATLDDDQNSGFPLEITEGGTWTYSEEYTCSTTRTDYGETSFWYKFSEDNLAKVTSGDLRDSDDASTAVNCYWPQIDITKTGDELSKITDKVYYDITVFNNTPADLNLRTLSCKISDPKIGYNETVELASGAKDENLDIEFTIPQTDDDPFVNTASVTCSPLNSAFSVSDGAEWSTNLFQPGVEIIKTGPLYATSGDVITYTFTINNKSSSDSPNLMLDTLSDDVLGDLADDAPAACDELAYNGTCSFTVDYTVPDVGLQPTNHKNIVTVHYHPASFPNDITDTDDHTIVVAPRSQLTDTSFCPLNNNQFRLMYHLEVAPNIYRLQASNPGQWYFNGFYYGTPGSDFTMTLQIPYPFVTQEGAGNPIQVHDGTTLTSSGCYLPNPSLTGFTITTPAMTPASSAENQIITPEDYTTEHFGQYTTVTVTGKVPATGMAYVTIHLDYALKKTGGWKQPGTFTTNPVTGASIADVNNQTLGITIHGYEVYNFARTVGSDTAITTPSSFNEFKKFAGFLGFVIDQSTGEGVANAKVVIYNPLGKVLAIVYTDADGYYMYAYKHTAKSATYKVTLPGWAKSVSVTVKANGLAAVNFDVP